MRSISLAWVIGVGAAVACAPAWAAASSDAENAVTMKPYITVDLQYTIPDTHRDARSGIGEVLSGGLALSKHFGVELGGEYNHFNANSSAPGYPWRNYAARLGGMYFFNRERKFEPFLTLGGGWTRNVLTSNNQADNSPFADAGFGMMSFWQIAHSWVGFRAQALYRWTFIDTTKFTVPDVNKDFREPLFSVGVVIPIGATVAENQAPPPPPPAEQAPPPPPPAAKQMNPNQKFEDIHFAFDKSKLTDYAKASLDSDAATIQKLEQEYPDLKVDISGNTDWIGTAEYNMGLSERRANAAKDYLVRKGVDGSRVTTYAYGETKPIAPNTTSEGRALNRRDEIRTHSP
jgi:Outer membrane protein and related peptidoglycan-associated (lipo)proteins